MELDAPKSQDLSKVMADIRAQYDELARKNQEELDKFWSQQVHQGEGWMPAGHRGPRGWEGGRQRRRNLRLIPALQIEESTTVVTSQNAEKEAAEATLIELRRTVQSLEIDLVSLRNVVRAALHLPQLLLSPDLCRPKAQSCLSPNLTPSIINSFCSE